MKIADLYDSVTRSIIASLETGVAPWTRPWKLGRNTGIMPHNGATNRPYSGINVMILWAEREEKGYTTSNWMTYRQALVLGGQVRGGEQATIIVFTKRITYKDKETEEEKKKVGMLRTYAVFNADQIDGLPQEAQVEISHFTRIAQAELFIQTTKADIRLGGNKACYVPSLDFIALPPQKQFRSVEHFYATNLHELAHWSGHKSRVDRDLSKRFGTKTYAAEELVAEPSAAFLCGHLNIPGELRHADYIATWIALLKEDDRAIFTAASKAASVADYLRAFSEPEQTEEEA
jgi:antirestriction protein ArdC